MQRALERAGLEGCVDIDTDEPSTDTKDSTGTQDARNPVENLSRLAVLRDGTAALVGWCPAEDFPRLASGLEEVGGALVALPRPRGVDPPTLLRDTSRTHRAFSPLVRGYTTVPYADVDPTLPAGFAYVLMFGLMFGDVGHGLILVACALLLRSGRIRALTRIRSLWPFVAGAGVAGIAAGLLYGEFFGPTGVVPTLWLRPLDQPERLLAYAVGLGVLLLAAAYGVGIVNRWREGGARSALYAGSGVAGALLFLGALVFAGGVWKHSGAAEIAGAVLASAGAAAGGLGLAAEAPRGAAGGLQVGLGMFDMVTRIGANVISFARLAAFGLTHAALGAVVWQGTTGLAHRGPLAVVCAVLLFAVGNALAFALEGLVVGVQAMRLEYYELFSRLFVTQGRPFHPFRLFPTPPEATP
jgi:V/A-type H+-transporting ATPase subunit I